MGSPYPYFAENLRQLCAGRESISQVCRDLGINRQQFGKYLSGKLGASEKTLDAICAYFGVSKVDLLYMQLAPGSGGATKPASPSQVEQQLLGNLARSDPVRLRPGLYFCHYGATDFPDHFIRSLVSIRRVDGVMVFTRWFTTYPVTGRSASFNQRTDGLVVQHDTHITLLGQDTARAFPPSMVRLSPIDSHNMILTGINLVSMPLLGTTSARCTLTNASPALSLRQAMKMCGIRSYAEDKLDELVVDSLRESTSVIQPYKPGLAYFADAIRAMTESNS